MRFLYYAAAGAVADSTYVQYKGLVSGSGYILGGCGSDCFRLQ